MKYRRWTALLLAAAMAVSLFCPGVRAGELSESDEADLYAPQAEAVQEDTELDQWEPEEDSDRTDAADAQEAEAEPELPEDASDPEEEAEAVEYSYLINPGYENLVSMEDIQADLSELEEEPPEAQAAAKTYTSLKAAGAAVRSQMKQRKSEFVVKFKTKDKNAGAVAMSLIKEACKHTGNPTEGDYIYRHLNYYAYKAKYKASKKKRTYTLRYKIRFLTSAAQEKQMDAAVKNLLTSLNLAQDSSFIKLHKIYNYVCSNVTYDYAGLRKNSPLCYTAYSALTKKTAVCQGYASLLYRLLLEAGVPCRLVTGHSHGEGHAWNIVRLDQLYYNLDSTWDASSKAEGHYFQHFLRCNANFPDHLRDSEFRTAAFNKSYPMSPTDGDYHVWEANYTVDAEPTCTTAGSQSIHCEDCGAQSNVTAIPALGHDWQVYGDLALYDGYYAARYCCQRCGTVTGWYYYAYTQAAEGPGDLSPAQAIAPAPGEDADQLPERGTLCSVEAKKGKKLRVKWKKEEGATGYELQYSRDRSFRKGVKTKKVTGKTALTLKSLKRGRTYYVRMRVLCDDARSGWSTVGKAKVK